MLVVYKHKALFTDGSSCSRQISVLCSVLVLHHFHVMLPVEVVSHYISSFQEEHLVSFVCTINNIASLHPLLMAHLTLKVHTFNAGWLESK